KVASSRFDSSRGRRRHGARVAHEPHKLGIACCECRAGNADDVRNGRALIRRGSSVRLAPSARLFPGGVVAAFLSLKEASVVRLHDGEPGGAGAPPTNKAATWSKVGRVFRVHARLGSIPRSLTMPR